MRDNIIRVLISDINHHVRDFLRRELEKEGFSVCSARDSLEMLRLLQEDPAIKTVVLDSQFLTINDQLLEKITNTFPALHIILHTYADQRENLLPAARLHVVEKSGSSINALKKLLHAQYQAEGATKTTPKAKADK